MTTVDELARRTHEAFGRVRSDLEDLVRIPSVSSPAFDQAHVRASAEAVAALLRDAGMPQVDVLEVELPDGGKGRPAVVAHRPGPDGAPTVLLYAHHDVQPPGDPAGWTSDPFEPTQRGERLYGRGAADDKAGIMAHVGALRVLGDELAVGVTVFVEGEEEIGSPTFTPFLQAYRDRLEADVIVVADSSNWKVGVPALTTSLRGLVDCEVEVRVLGHAVHSGMFGGPVLDAVTLMSRLVATLHDDNGDVAVAGLASRDEADVDYPEDQFRSDAAGWTATASPAPARSPPACGRKPAFSVIRPRRRPRRGRRAPATATSPLFVVQRRDQAGHSAVTASSTGPPNIPEWTACPSTRTSTSQSTRPRSDVVRAGTPTFQLLESATTMTSASRRSR
ncbi:peptidase-like protein [Georgenia soli]|uniref:Peptidase-like protein n=1 Tax=Georgenia soli TaxID=638953 RepID=A0A2A9ESX5_9MICO|nr:peptidase-like protein [Georgenia soli]